MVAAGRREPDLPIGRLRAQGRLIDLRARDLVMTRREAAAMLSLAGLELEPDDVLVLLERTEGWPAGLYLAALSLGGRQDVHRAVARFGGDDRLLADYVRDELLGPLDAEQLAFLEETSVLDELSGPLCDAVLHRRGSGKVLRDMSRSNLLVVPLDDADGSYRYHPLLGDMLQAELRRTRPQCEAELHRRASDWYARAGDADRAIDHAIDAGDAERAGELLWATAAARVFDGRGAEVRRRLERFTPEQIAAHPTLALTAASQHLAKGERDLVEHWTAAAQRRLNGSAPASLYAGVETMRAAVARDGIDEMVSDAARAYGRSPDDSPWRSLCCLLRGVGEHLRGDAATARTHLEEGARRGAIARAQRPVAVPGPAGAARDRGRRLGAGAAARRPRSRAGGPPRPRAPPGRRARLRGARRSSARTASASRTPRPTGGARSRSSPRSSTTSRGTTPRPASCSPARRSASAT